MDIIKEIKILIEALPYVNLFSDKIFVIKFGGSIAHKRDTLVNFAQDIALLRSAGIKIVIVHGGGNLISDTLSKFNIKTEFFKGLRITNEHSIDIVEMILSGSVNKKIVSTLNEHKVNAIGISGKDCNMIISEVIGINHVDGARIDFANTGIPDHVNPEILYTLLNNNFVPIISPICISKTGRTLNTNADSVAGVIASALCAQKLIIMTDVEGILDENQNLISKTSISDIANMIQSGVINSGMIPKVETCIGAIQNNVKHAHILNGNKYHLLLLEIFTQAGCGTLINS